MIMKVTQRDFEVACVTMIQLILRPKGTRREKKRGVGTENYTVILATCGGFNMHT